MSSSFQGHHGLLWNASGVQYVPKLNWSLQVEKLTAQVVFRLMGDMFC